MTHGARIYADQFYQSPNTPAASWWETVDATLYAAINGDGGGTWAPSSPIVITGTAGMIAAGPWTLSGTASLTASTSTPITLGDSDYVQLKSGHTGASRSLLTSCGELIDVSDLTSQINAYFSSPGNWAVTTTLGTTSSARLLLPLRVHNGAPISTITFTFQITTHVALPSQFPQFRVYQLDTAGNITPLYTGTVGGYLALPQPANVTTYHNGGATQTLTYTPTTTFIVDTSKYTYFAEIIDESGSGAVAGNKWYAATVNFVGIADQRPQ